MSSTPSLFPVAQASRPSPISAMPPLKADKVVFVDTEDALREMISSIEALPDSPPSLYVDLEGENLGRHGVISIMQIYVLPSYTAYLIDVHTLQDMCFSTASGLNGRTLKDIMESPATTKVFFDVRVDADALYSQFGIHLQGVQDLQLMELATRTFSRRLVNGLGKCIERDAQLSETERLEMMRVKEKGIRLFAPEKGGSYKVFSQRPPTHDIVAYCAQDVAILPRLWKFYDEKLTVGWRSRVQSSSAERVVQARAPGFVGQGRHMAMAPKGWDRK